MAATLIFLEKFRASFGRGLLKQCSESKELYLEMFYCTPLCKSGEAQVCVAEGVVFGQLPSETCFFFFFKFC